VLDPLTPIELPPGLFSNGTIRQARGRWFDANLVRFFGGAIGPVGGWQRLQSDAGVDLAALSGVPRAALAFRSDTHGILQVFSTPSHVHAIVAGTLNDITPAGFTPGTTDTGFVNPTGKYGAGLYGAGRFGTGSQTAARQPATTWQLDNFGNLLVGVSSSEKKLYTWDGDPLVLPTVPAGAPSSVLGVVCTPERYLFALGVARNSADTAYIANSRSVAWPDQETIDGWGAAGALLTRGDFELTTNGNLVCGRASRGETLLWTDDDLHTATWIGGVFVYQFKRVGEKCGIIAPNAVALSGGVAMWMGRNSFFVYDGFVKPIPCDVHDRVFDNMNELQAVKTWAMTKSEFNEVWFYYVSKASNEIDSYVAYNYVEGHWTTGKLIRTAGYDAGTVPSPVLLDAAGLIYEHEQTGASHSGAAIYLESGPVEPGEGDRNLLVSAIVPDVRQPGDATLTIYGAPDATSPETTHGPYTLDGHPTDARFIAKQLRLRYDATDDSDWRVGIVRLAGRPSSRR
jgi:hypothetical protein